VARKIILICDNCHREIPEGKGAVVRAIFNDARQGVRQADFCNDCTMAIPGRQVARRGRRPRAAAS
jgi:hypothetical protein